MHPATTFVILEGLHLIPKKKFSTCCLLPFEPPLPERTMGKPSGFPTFSFGNMVWKIVSFLSLRYWNTYCFNSHKTNEGSPFQASDIYFSHMLYQPYNTVSLSYKLICVLQGIRSERKGRPAYFHRLEKHNLFYFKRFMSYWRWLHMCSWFKFPNCFMTILILKSILVLQYLLMYIVLHQNTKCPFMFPV